MGGVYPNNIGEIMKFTEDKKVIDNTAVHTQALKGRVTKDKDSLKLTDNDSWSEVQIRVSKGWTTEDKNILKLSNGTGHTIAHEQAIRGWTTEDKEILKLDTIDGWTVAYIQVNQGWVPPEHLRNLKIDERTLWEVYLKTALRGL